MTVVYPEDRLLIDANGHPAPLASVQVWTDEAMTLLAPITDPADVPIPGSWVTSDLTGYMPLFKGADGGLWVGRYGSSNTAGEVLPRIASVGSGGINPGPSNSTYTETYQETY